MNNIDTIRAFATQIDTSILPKPPADQAHLQLFLTTFFSILAAIALLALVIAGLRYVNSTGDPSTMSKTKNTIIYSSIGLVVSMTAVAIVTFVLNNL
jgi:uncharacterized membrane protein YidH (DUF202 family)